MKTIEQMFSENKTKIAAEVMDAGREANVGSRRVR